MILVVALLVLGPDKLPSTARQVGRFVGEMRRMSSAFQAEMRDAIQEPVDGTPGANGTTPAQQPSDEATIDPMDGPTGTR